MNEIYFIAQLWIGFFEKYSKDTKTGPKVMVTKGYGTVA